jgi:hypothetical protein
VKAPSTNYYKNTHNLIQLLSPACIAANFEENKILRTARLLRKVDDGKVSNVLKKAPTSRYERGYLMDLCGIIQVDVSLKPQDKKPIVWRESARHKLGRFGLPLEEQKTSNDVKLSEITSLDDDEDFTSVVRHRGSTESVEVHVDV